MIYREIQEADIPILAELEKECFAQPWSEESFRGALNARITAFFICEEDGEILGYGGVQCLPPEGAITNIAVRVGARRRGIGNGLVNQIAAHCAGACITGITLEVRESNTKATQLYEKCGFERLGVRKNFYARPRENAVIMRKILP